MTMIELAISAARAAGDIIREAASDIQSLEIEQKSRFDYVSRVDRESEAKVKALIKDAYPDHQFLGEESGFSAEPKRGVHSDQDIPLWIVDPLDGTTNFLREIPHYAVSIAVQVNGRLEHGVVYDVYKDELFEASAGKGAKLNGRSLNLPLDNSFAGALLATGVPFSGQNLEGVDAFAHTMTDLLDKGTSGIRRLGSAALDLAYVAAGRYDGYWEAHLKPWDIAAGALLVLEAGGRVGDFSGEDGFLESGDIVAAPTGVYEEIVAVTRDRYSRG